MDDRGERASRTGGFTEREGLDVPPDRATEDDAPETTRGDQPRASRRGRAVPRARGAGR